MIERVPASGSCARCRAALGLTSTKLGGVWYCSPRCADGLAPGIGAPRDVARLAVPRRFFRARAPKELRRPG